MGAVERYGRFSRNSSDLPVKPSTRRLLVATVELSFQVTKCVVYNF
jgi:hypothetical protein